MTKLKEGDLYAGRPLRMLDDPEADAAASTLGVDRGAADALYGKGTPRGRFVKGSQEARDRMAEIRAKRGKRKDDEKKGRAKDKRTSRKRLDKNTENRNAEDEVPEDT